MSINVCCTNFAASCAAARFRFAEPAPLAPGRRKATEFNQPGLVRMERQFELLQPRAHRNEETASVVLLVEAEHCIVDS